MKLYQNTERIEVIVKKDLSGANGEDNTTNTTTADDSVDGSLSSDKLSSAFNKRFIKVNASHLFAVSKQLATRELHYRIANQSLQTGDEAYQDQISRKVEVVEDYTNMASSVTMGALYGSAGGWVGSILGAVFGGVSTGINIAYKYRERERDYSYKMFKEETSIEYKRARAEINLTTGRLR
jgi:hypothetical protein